MNGPFFHGLRPAVLTAAVGLGLALALAPAPARAGAEGALFAPVEPAAEAPAPPAQATEKRKAVRGQAAKPSPEIVTDAQGRKTLVIHGDSAAAKSSPEIVVDAQGRKTLVIRGDGAAAAPEAAAEAEAEAPAERPYWAAEREAPARPYWLAEPEAPVRPYWLPDPEAPVRPYWLPAPPPEEPAPPRAAASLAPAGDGEGDDTRTISYYMYQDEAGVRHLTNAPADPRYRLFTVTVTIRRGLAGTRALHTPGTLGGIIDRAARLHSLDPALIMAVIKAESAFDARAVSWAGAQGLMQLMPGTARDMGCVNPFDPEDNVMGGSRYLRLMLDRFGDVSLALAAYNCGPERVAREGRRIPDIPETRNYVKIVLRHYDRYQGRR